MNEDKLIQLIEDYISTENMPEEKYTKNTMLKELWDEYYVLTGKRIEESQEYKKLKTIK